MPNQKNFDSNKLNILIEKTKKNIKSIDLQKLNEEIESLQSLTAKSDFWEKNNSWEKIKKLNNLNKKKQQIAEIQKLIEDIEINQLLLKDQTVNQEKYVTNLKNDFAKLKKLNQKLVIDQFLIGKYDDCDIIFSIHAGAGGTEAMDWVGMLKRMYLKYFESNGYKISLIDQSLGEEVGYKEVSFRVEGYYPYGYFKWEKGTHRLIRLSPFNANNLRQTSFALVEVTPLIKNQIKNEEINNNDLEWHFSRSGGPGGQNVNKVSSAVELTYKPLNLTVRCRQLKSQSQNKQLALEILEAKIALLKEEQNQKEIDKLKGNHKTASFGNQIRNYILHPYKLVKDTRTKTETNQAQNVLDGDLDLFINAEIKFCHE